MSITRHRRFKHVLAGVALSTLMAGFVALTTAPANAGTHPDLIDAPELHNTSGIVFQQKEGNAVALDNPGYSKDDVPLIAYKRNDGSNQRWNFTRQEDGTYKIMNIASRKCATAGTRYWVYQTKCEKGPKQSWTIKKISWSDKKNPIYEIVNVGTGKGFGQGSSDNKVVQARPHHSNWWRIGSLEPSLNGRRPLCGCLGVTRPPSISSVA